MRDSVLSTGSCFQLLLGGLPAAAESLAYDPDVVVYDDLRGVTHALKIDRNELNEEVILLLKCPPMEPLTDRTPCWDVVLVLRVSEFQGLVCATVIQEAAKGSALKPLTADDLQALRLRDQHEKDPATEGR